jgi:hypothetical protein
VLSKDQYNKITTGFKGVLFNAGLVKLICGGADNEEIFIFSKK